MISLNDEKIPWQEGLIRNRYSGRTFIEGNDRAAKARRKYIPLPEVLEGKRVLLVEDSIVRSTTMKALIGQLRERGRVKEIHVRVACPPIKNPCFYGVDFPTKEELIANNRTVKEIETFLGVDSLGYISLDGLLSCASLPADHYCTACWSGNYPIPVETVVNKFSMERHQMQLFDNVE